MNSETLTLILTASLVLTAVLSLAVFVAYQLYMVLKDLYTELKEFNFHQFQLLNKRRIIVEMEYNLVKMHSGAIQPSQLLKSLEDLTKRYDLL